jgi:SAM-dependent methyltransferase
MTDVWSDRAEGYRTSESHATGDDLETLVLWCEPAVGTTALDVATGGGHVARRLREEGCTVVTSDPAPGMEPDVICHAEDLPFADGAFAVVVSRIAPHHFGDIRAAVAEMARVSSGLVVIEDTLYVSEQQEEAETLRDPTHVRSYSELEWKQHLEGAGLEVERVAFFQKRHALEEWLARTGCVGEEAQRVTQLLAPLLVDGGKAWQDTKILLRARKAGA